MAAVIGPMLERKGFTPRKQRFDAADGFGNIRRYEICLSKVKGHFSLHLRVGVSNAPWMRDVDKDRLLRGVAFAEEWFSSARSEQWIIEQTVYPALYLPSARGKSDTLDGKCGEALSKSRSRKEAALFFAHLRTR